MVNPPNIFKDWYDYLSTWKECVKCGNMIAPNLCDRRMDNVTFICKYNCK